MTMDIIFKADTYLACIDSYEDFRCYKRPSNFSIADHCNTFRYKLSRLERTGTVLADSVKTCKLLKSANLTNAEELF